MARDSGLYAGNEVDLKGKKGAAPPASKSVSDSTAQEAFFVLGSTCKPRKSELLPRLPRRRRRSLLRRSLLRGASSSLGSKRWKLGKRVYRRADVDDRRSGLQELKSRHHLFYLSVWMRAATLPKDGALLSSSNQSEAGERQISAHFWQQSQQCTHDL